MTEITVRIDWPHLILAIVLGPAVATTVMVLVSMIYPPVALCVFLIGWVSLCAGYISYLLLAGPLMVLAQWLGGDHPVLHAIVGFGAVWLIVPAYQLGLPVIAPPDATGMAQWLGPIWCATAAYIYNVLRHEFIPQAEAL